MRERMDVQPLPNFPDFEKVIDGFFYDFRLRPNCLSYLPLALGHGVLPTRAAFGDRMGRMLMFPTNPKTRISSVGFYEEQASFVAGSIIWGMGVATDNPDALENYSIRVTDLQLGVKIFSSWVSLKPFEFAANEGLPVVLNQPIIILAPGTMLFEIGARDAVEVESLPAIQVVFFFSEPLAVCDPAKLQVE